MTDPVGLIGGASPLHNPQKPAMNPGAPNAPEGGSFAELLREELEGVNQKQQDVTRAIEDLTAGRRDDPENVILAMQEADAAFRMLLQVRNKMMDAYNELRQVRV